MLEENTLPEVPRWVSNCGELVLFIVKDIVHKPDLVITKTTWIHSYPIMHSCCEHMTVLLLLLSFPVFPFSLLLTLVNRIAS